jgi:hypothetical protein
MLSSANNCKRRRRRQLAAAMQWTEGETDRHLAALGKTVGPPWRRDEKLAAAASWLVLIRHGRPGKTR